MYDLNKTIDEFIKLNTDKEDKNNLLLQIYYLHKLISRYPKTRAFSYISRSTHQYYKNIDDYNMIKHQKLHLLLLIKESLKELDSNKHTEQVKLFYRNFFNRTTQRIIDDKLVKSFYEYTSVGFLKFQSICCLQTLPISPLIFDKDKLPTKILFNNTLKHFFSTSFYIIFKLNGISPLYKTHTNFRDINSLLEFNQKGWERMFITLFESLNRQKGIKGICGSAWFFDPVIKEISPELAYINRILTDIGAILFKVNSDADTIEDAIFFNPKRKQLYENGLYQPQNYLFIITRSDLIKWGQTQNMLPPNENSLL